MVVNVCRCCRLHQLCGHTFLNPDRAGSSRDCYGYLVPMPCFYRSNIQSIGLVFLDSVIGAYNMYDTQPYDLHQQNGVVRPYTCEAQLSSLYYLNMFATHVHGTKAFICLFTSFV